MLREAACRFDNSSEHDVGFKLSHATFSKRVSRSPFSETPMNWIVRSDFAKF